MTNAIMPFNELQSIAQALAKSGYFKDSGGEAQAIVKVLAGQEMGLGPFAAMTGIHVIQGKPVLGANLIATLIKNDPRYNYRVMELTDDVCSIDFYENGTNIGNSTMTIADAKKAGSKNLDKFPRNMLFARALSNGAKWYTPGIFGGAPVYTPDEFGMDVDDDGDPVVIEATAKEHQHDENPLALADESLLDADNAKALENRQEFWAKQYNNGLDDGLSPQDAAQFANKGLADEIERRKASA